MNRPNHDAFSQLISQKTKRDKKNMIRCMIASEESFLLSMGDPKNAIKSLILVVEQFCIKHFLILFQFLIDSKHEPARPEPARPRR